MTFGSYSRKTIGGVEVRSGAVFPMGTAIRWEIAARCVSVDPEEYVGMVLVDGKIVMETEPMPANDPGRAWDQARFELVTRLQTLGN
ncbi:MAG: hypothetical protein ACJ74O_18935 [Frankiaceae bacterium]